MDRRPFLPQSIAGRLMLLLLLIALIPSVVLVTTMFLIVRTRIEGGVKDRLAHILSNRVQQIETYVRERQREVVITARAPALVQAMS